MDARDPDQSSGELFADRQDAGRRLAEGLAQYTECRGGLILGIPRGGVIVGLELSLRLRLPLDVLITRKLGVPDNPELAMGALAETGFVYRNEALLTTYPRLSGDLDQARVDQEEEIERRRVLYRGGRALPPLEDRVVLLVDDGVATGATYLASVAALRSARVARVVAALPLAPADTVQVIAGQVDECVVLATPAPFYAVGQGYRDFRQVTDEEVMTALQQGWRPS